MDQVVSVEEGQGYEKLTAIQNNSIEAQADVAAKLVQRLTKVETHALIDQAQVLIVVERVVKANQVLLIIGVVLVESSYDLLLFES